MIELPDIPVEILLCITQYSSKADVSRICMASRAMYSLCIQQLYFDIDLSSHNATVKSTCYGYPQLPVPLNFIERQWTDLDREIRERQDLFIRTILDKPDIGKKVRHLKWTVLPSADDLWPDEVMMDRYDEAFLRDEEVLAVYPPEDEPLWQVFQSFSKLASVDFCWLRDWREITLPENAFQSATRVRLSGCMSRELVYHILGRPSSNSPQDASLESLELNNLLTWSTTDPRLPQAHHLRDVSAFVRDFDSRGTNFRMIPETRFMTELLDPLVGYFTALRSLRITTHGEFENSGRNVEQTPHQALYASWARFLASVRDTLEHFSFEQGIDHRDKYESEQPRLCTTGRHLQPRTVDRPMDVLFLEWLLPVLLEGPWPCMRHMEIRGVGRCSKSIGYRQLPLPDPLLSPEPLGRDVEYRICGDTPDSRGMYRVAQTRIAFTAAAKEKLRKILGDRVTLVIDESQSTDYECPKWDAHGIPSLPELPYEE